MNDNNEYEKLQLTKQDLQHIYGQIYSDTTKKLNLHLPTGPDDILKQQVANLLDDFLIEIFEMALNALVIDGNELSKINIKEVLSLNSSDHQKIEPFDFKLNSQLRSSLQQLEEETIKVSKYRRELPLDVRSAYNQLVQKTDNEVTDILRELDEANDRNGDKENVEDMDTSSDSIIDSSRLKMIESDFQESLKRLVELKETVPAQRAEIEKLDETLAFLEDLHRKR